MNVKRKSMLAFLGLLTLAPLAGSAQVTPPPGGQRQRMELERRLRLGFQRTVQNQLNLGEDQLSRLQEIMQSFQGERSELNRAQASLRYRLRDPALPDMSDDDARAILQEMIDVQARELDLYRREQEALLSLLTPVQLVRFYRLRDDLGQRVEELRRGRGMGPGGGGGNGGIRGPGLPGPGGFH